jgi:hypothetical protein
MSARQKLPQSNSSARSRSCEGRPGSAGATLTGACSTSVCRQGGRVAFEGVQLTTETLRGIAAVGAQIQITVYCAEIESPFVVPPCRRATNASGKRR